MSSKQKLFLWIGFFTLLGCAGSQQTVKTADGVDHSVKVSNFDIPIVINDKVNNWLGYFQGAGRERFALYLERSHRYLPMMRAVFREQGLPEDLVYVAMIESGFNPKAFSRARASGTWQFIYRTGLRYGLRIDAWVDERRDPQKATLAAALYLRDLYSMFNDWYLAMASYNAGEGKVSRAIKRYETEDFWEVSARPYLRPETKNYVPKMIAATLISKNPRQFGFKQLNFHDPMDHETVLVDGLLDLRVAARLAETSYQELRDLNPALKLWLTPPNSQYELHLPAGTAKKFEAKLAELPSEERYAEEIRPLKKGETLKSLAKKMGLPLAYLIAVNGRTHVTPGQQVLIPYAPPDGEQWALINEGDRKRRRIRQSRRVAKVSAESPRVRKKAKTSRARRQAPLAPKVATTEKEV